MSSQDKAGSSAKTLLTGILVGAGLVLVVMIFFNMTATPTDYAPIQSYDTNEGTIEKAPRNSDGAFEGTVRRVWEDGFRLDVGDRSLRVDAWSVCGDNTARNINTGDQLSVYATRGLLEYDAWRILNENGEPVC